MKKKNISRLKKIILTPSFGPIHLATWIFSAVGTTMLQ